MKYALLAAAVGSALAAPAFAAPATNALPTGEVVVRNPSSTSDSPAASVSRPAEGQMRIDQTEARATINWQSFSIGSAAKVDVVQPDRSSVLLNRVLGNSPTEIFGQLNANGQVFLVNQNGVRFAPGASIEAAGILASTLSISDNDFFAGRNQFFRDGNAGSVINQGRIVTPNGYTALAGPQVSNEGTIIANLGTVALAAGDRVTLDMVGDGLINVSVDQAAINASAVNTGILQADGGKVLITAKTAHALLDTVINNTGTIRANRMAERDGVIVLEAGDFGTVHIGGTMEASGSITATGGSGGSGPVIEGPGVIAIPRPVIGIDPGILTLNTADLTTTEGINWQSFNISTSVEAAQFVTASGTLALTSVLRTASTADTQIHGSLMLTNQVGLIAPLQHNVIGTGVLVPTGAFFTLQ